MMFTFGKANSTIRMTVVTVFAVATTLTALLAISLQNYFGQSLAGKAATDLFSVGSSSMASEYLQVAEINTQAMDLLSHIPGLLNSAAEKENLGILTRVLNSSPLNHSVYVGRDDGSFFEVVDLDSDERTRKKLRALPTDRWMVNEVTVSQGKSVLRSHYLDENLDLRISNEKKTDFDPREEPWYSSALSSDAVQKSPPHLFPELGIPSRTISQRIADKGSVVGVRLILSRASDFLTAAKFHEQTDVFLYNGNGDIYATSRMDTQDDSGFPAPEFQLSREEKKLVRSLSVLTASNEMDWAPFDYAQAGKPRGYSVDIIRILAEMTGLKVEFVNGLTWSELVDEFEQGKIDLLHSVILTEENRSLGLPGTSYISLPYALATRDGRTPLRSLGQLTGRSLAIPRGWSIIPVIRSRFPDIIIDEVDNTQKALEAALAGKVDAALDNEVIMRHVARHYFLEDLQFHSDLDLGEGRVPDKLHLLVSHDRPGLRALIDRAIGAVGKAQRDYLSTKWLDFESGPQLAASSAVPSNTLIEIAGDPRLQNRIIETSLDDVPYIAFVTPMASADEDSDPLFIGILTPLATVQEPFLSKVRLSIFITACFLGLLLPLSWFFANPIVRPIRRLAQENDKVRLRQYDQVERIGSNIKELDELSESMVNMVASIQAHELAQRRLMDSFIELIAQAIDDKSPYTGGHCKRVPELAVMLAKHASESDHPSFREFRLENDDQWREFRIAAWLHDCGKITTPEHIVDKGTKLETIYNRIHEVRMRFEVLWRDAVIDYLEKVAAEPEAVSRHRAELEERHEQLQEDFAFVAQCNVGGEFLGREEQARLHNISRTCWQRHFDDRLGLSPVEETRLSQCENNLPAEEPLLRDAPEHLISSARPTAYPPELGIDMIVPEYESNLGEIYNLSVSRGTLTEEDRFRIKEHMISTIKMLESLPFPEELKNVPRYASTHHETMTGSGYPRRLLGEELSVPEKLLAVADVFEALTASDRPYKKAKTVRQALEILNRMVLGGHIDRDCFELFVREKIYLEYADRFLPADQIGAIDPSRYLESGVGEEQQVLM